MITEPAQPSMDNAKMLASLIEQNHHETKARLASMATAVVEALKQAIGQAQTGMSDSAKALHRAEEVAKSLSSAQDELKKMLVTETAAASAARTELWNEAAKFRNTVYRQIRWFIRLPAILVVVITIAFTSRLLLRRPPIAPTSPLPPAAAAKKAQKRPMLPPTTSRPTNTARSDRTPRPDKR